MDSKEHILMVHGVNGKDYSLHITQNIYAVSDPEEFPGVEKVIRIWITVQYNENGYRKCLGRIFHKNRRLRLTQSVDEFLSTVMDLDFASYFWETAKKIGATHIITVSPVARFSGALYIPLSEEEANRLERSFEAIQEE